MNKMSAIIAVIAFVLGAGIALAGWEDPEVVDMGNGLRLVPETTKEGGLFISLIIGALPRFFPSNILLHCKLN